MPAVARRFDAVIVGGGHNGLVCAAYLAGAGLGVCVLERRDVVGGAAVTETFFPGFRNSTASYTVGLLHPRVMRDLRLAEHGLVITERPFANFVPLPDARALRMGGGIAASQAEVARFSPADALRLPEYYARLERVADIVRALMLVTPPDLATQTGASVDAILDAWQLARRFRTLDIALRRDVLELFTRSAGDLLDRWFACEPLKAALGFDAVVGHYASPYTPGSGYMLLHLAQGDVNGRRGQWGHAQGGMGAVTQAMARECVRRGVTLRTGAPVAEVRVQQGRAVGVTLADGESIDATRVVANVTPKVLFEQLVARGHLPQDFRERIAGYRCASGTFRMNVALSTLPDFRAAPGSDPQPHHASGIVLAPSLGYMERAYFDARTRGWSQAPIVEMLIPSVVDASLAPPGLHVASLFCQHVHPTLGQVQPGRDWDAARDEVAALMLDTVNAWAPNFRASVLGHRALTPLDLERDFGLTGGDIHHGTLTLDQLFAARPVLGHASYRAPVRRLYMCGAGTHPGGGVSGVPGLNAAREILRDVRRRRFGRERDSEA
jgi:phytoene dehydrogenase-like protein